MQISKTSIETAIPYNNTLDRFEIHQLDLLSNNLLLHNHVLIESLFK